MVLAPGAGRAGTHERASDPGFGCTGSLGGIDDPLLTRSALFKVQGRAKVKGAASVYGSANHDRALDESTMDNNLTLLNVTVK